MWTYDSALQRGIQVEVKLIDTVDGEEVDTKLMTWTRSQGQPGDNVLSKAQTKAMIKREIKALLLHLNVTESEVDITSDIRP